MNSRTSHHALARAGVFLVLAAAVVAPRDDARSEHPLPGPHFVECEVEGDTVHLRWDVLDIDPSTGTRAFVERDDARIAELAPGDVSYDDFGVPIGAHVWSVVVTSANGVISARRCEAEVVAGASGVECTVDGNVVSIEWTLSDDVFAFGFLVSRDGEIVAMLPADARAFREELRAGEYHYFVSTNNRLGGPNAGGAPPDFLIGECRVVVEEGGPLPGPRGLQCSILESFPIQVGLSWTNPVRYDALIVTRGGARIARLDGDASSFREPDPGPGRHVYGVFGLLVNEISTTASCVVEIDPPNRSHRLRLVSGASAANAVGTNASDRLRVLLENPEPVQAWSFGVCSDPSVLEVAAATVAGTSAGALNDGAGPSFLVVDAGERGLTMAAVVDERDPADVLPPGDHSLLDVRYAPGPDAAPGERYEVDFCDVLGAPPVAIVVVVDGLDRVPETSSGTVTFRGPRFLRADANNDNQVNMSDGVFLLDWLFRSGRIPGCFDAADANASSDVNIADAVWVFQTLFSGGPPPPPPFPECGSVPPVLGCERSACSTI